MTSPMKRKVGRPPYPDRSAVRTVVSVRIKESLIPAAKEHAAEQGLTLSRWASNLIERILTG